MATPNELVGKTLGDYVLAQLLGAGNFSAVYKATQTRLNREVAIKILLPQMPTESSHDWQSRFQREVQTTATLQHPHMVKVHDYQVDAATGISYIVMEYMPGGTLGQRLAKERLPQDIALRILNQIAQALDFAHDQHIIHRDLNPTNIFLDRQFNAYLGDFGLVKLKSVSSELSGIWIPSGAPHYMPPEQWKEENVEPQTDVYAFGITAYLLLTGVLPFEGEDIGTLRNKHLTEKAAAPSSLNPQLPRAIDPVFARVLAKAWNERYERAGRFMQALTNALTVMKTVLDHPLPKQPAPPPPYHPPQAPPSWQPPAAYHPRPIPTYQAAPMPAYAPPPPHYPYMQAPKRRTLPYVLGTLGVMIIIGLIVAIVVLISNDDDSSGDQTSAKTEPTVILTPSLGFGSPLKPTLATNPIADTPIPSTRSAAPVPTKGSQGYYASGYEKYENGDYSGAIADFTAALRIDPNDFDAYFFRGLSYYYQEDYSNAVNDFTAAININPNDSPIYNNRGLAYNAMGNTQAALTDYTAAITLNPENYRAYGNRGSLYLEQNNLEEAINDFSTAIRINPAYPNAYWGLGNAYYDQGEWDLALFNYEQFIELGGTSTFVQTRITELNNR